MKTRTGLAIGIIALLGAAAAHAGANSLTVVGPSLGLNGTDYALQVNVDDSASNAFVRSDEPSGETHYLCKFWIDPTGLDDPSGLGAGNAGTNHIRFLRFGDNDELGDTDLQGKFLVGFITKSAGDGAYHMIFWARQDGADSSTYNSVGNLYIGNAPRQVEIEFWQETSGTQSLRFTSVGANTVNKSGLNLGTADVDTFDFGIYNVGNPSGITGHTFLLDEFESYR